MTTPRPHYALVTVRNPRTGGLDTIGGQTPIVGEPEKVKRDLEKAMRGKCGDKFFVSVEIRDTPYQMENTK